MKVNDVLQCSFNSWYGQFSNVTIESVVIPLPSDVVQYLTADGIFVGGYSNDGEMEAAACAGESEVGEMANGEALSAAFKAQVERSIRQVGGEVFPKLNWSSPKDATWITPGHSLKCTNVDEVFILLKSSDFVVHDLTEPFLECEDVGFPVPCIPYTLVLRRWMDLDRCNEFRCFVKDEYLVAICQRHVDSYFRSLAESEDYKAQLVNVVSSFFQANIKPKFPLTRYTFDVYVDGDKVLLLDFNPWGIVTDSFLFSWQELDSIAPSKSDEAAAANAWRPELRVITDKTIRSPGVFSGVYGVPLEYHRLAMAAQEGKAPYETLLELMEAQNLSDEEEMDNR